MRTEAPLHRLYVNETATEAPYMPILLWLLGVPLTLIIVLWLIGVF
jgi:hypothetical protein